MDGDEAVAVAVAVTGLGSAEDLQRCKGIVDLFVDILHSIGAVIQLEHMNQLLWI